ncbi:MAG TPA: hypothetical protein VKZ48_07060 [Burkholderiales bacterium]|nr:hypothetical protein [Burkholderiales bacterium]
MKQRTGTFNKTLALTVLASALAVSGAWASNGHGKGHGNGKPPAQKAEARNFQLVGYNDLQARSAYQPTIQNQDGRWIAYVGHHGGEALNSLTGQVEQNGVSIVDVTNPRNPVYLHHIAGAGGAGEAGGRQMTRVCSGDVLPSGEAGKWYLLTTRGNDAHEIYDVTDPANPSLLTVVVDNLNGTHKNWWDCQSGIAYLVSGVPGWSTNRHMQVFDLSDPSNPVFIRNFGVAGQQPGGTPPDPNYSLHGPIKLGNRVYMGYGTSSNGLLQILDNDILLTGDPTPTDENLRAPVIGEIALGPLHGAHTTMPFLNVRPPEFQDFTRGDVRNIVAISNESTANQCREAHQMVYFADITTEDKPHIVSNYHVDPESAKRGDYCDVGGRFGAHSSHENFNSPYGSDVLFVAYFNAGIRAVDMRNPWSPRELAYYVPAVNERTDERCVTTNGVETCKIAIQTNNLEIDDRGYVYAVDRANSGMHIVRLTREAERVLDRMPEAGTPFVGENDNGKNNGKKYNRKGNNHR